MSSTGGKYLKRLSFFDALSKGGASGRDSTGVGETVKEACISARTEFKLQDGFTMAMRSKSCIITLCVDQFAVVTLYTSLNCKNLIGEEIGVKCGCHCELKGGCHLLALVSVWTVGVKSKWTMMVKST